MWIVGDGEEIDGGSTGTWLGRETTVPGRVVIRQAVRGEADRPLRFPPGTTGWRQLDIRKKDQTWQGAAPEGPFAGTEKNEEAGPTRILADIFTKVDI